MAAVVLRQLPNHDQVTHHYVNLQPYIEMCVLKGWLQHKPHEILREDITRRLWSEIHKFTDRFVEFQKAEFKILFIEQRDVFQMYETDA